jgi:hypothetical protein
MGKGDRVENYYVKEDDEWIPIDLGRSKIGPKGQRSSKGSGSSSEEYYVQRDGKWVKISGIKSAADLMTKMTLSFTMEATPLTILQAPLEQYQTPIVVAPVQQGPMTYHEYIITIQPPSEQVQGTVESALPRRIPRQPLRATPNDYGDEPIVLQREPVYRESPSSAGRGRRRPPGPRPGPPRYDSPRRNCSTPPLPRSEPPHVDGYALGREAYYRQIAGGVDYVDESCGCDDDYDTQGLAVRNSPAPGYYLAGYLYYGDPSQPAPNLQPIQTPGAAQCPPGHYLAGYTTAGGATTQPAATTYPVPGCAVPGYPM